MLHLFNNVFIEQDQYINLSDAPDIIVASTEYATDDVKLNDAVTQAENTVAELLGDGTYKAWFTSLMSKNTRVVIYANNSNFANIVATWLKSSTNMDNDAYSLFIDCYDFHLKTHGKGNADLTTALKSAYSDANAIDFSDTDFDPSFEFLFASAMHDAGFAKKSKLVALLSKFLKRQYEEHILEIRRDIDRHALNSTLQTLLGGSGKTLSTINELPDMSVFSGDYWNDTPNVVSSKSYQPGSNSKIDLAQASDDEVDALVAVVKKVRLAVMNVTADDIHANLVDDVIGSYTYINTVKTGNLNDSQYNEVITSLTAKPIDIAYLPNDLEDTIVKVFLSHVRSLKSSSDLTALQKFTLK